MSSYLEVTNFLKLSLILNLQYICLILKLVLSYFLLTVYLFIILCVCVGELLCLHLHLYLCTPCMLDAHRGQKKVLEMIASCCVVAES